MSTYRRATLKNKKNGAKLEQYVKLTHLQEKQIRLLNLPYIKYLMWEFGCIVCERYRVDFVNCEVNLSRVAVTGEEAESRITEWQVIDLTDPEFQLVKLR